MLISTARLGLVNVYSPTSTNRLLHSVNSPARHAETLTSRCSTAVLTMPNVYRRATSPGIPDRCMTDLFSVTYPTQTHHHERHQAFSKQCRAWEVSFSTSLDSSQLRGLSITSLDKHDRTILSHISPHVHNPKGQIHPRVARVCRLGLACEGRPACGRIHRQTGNGRRNPQELRVGLSLLCGTPLDGSQIIGHLRRQCTGMECPFHVIMTPLLRRTPRAGSAREV